MATSIFHIRMKKELLDDIKSVAKKEKRTVAEIVRQLIVQYISGLIKQPKTIPALKNVENKLNKN